MRFPPLFSPSSSRTTSTAVVLGLSLCASVNAQSRNTEQGEASITGERSSLFALSLSWGGCYDRPSVFWLTFPYAVINHYFITTEIVHYVDPVQECTPYYYAPTASQLGNFPPIWTPATLLPNDTAGQAKWNSIKASIPTNIPVKGTITGNFSAFTPTYNPSDPDCWWTYDKCVTPKLAGLQPDVSNTPEPLSLGYGFDDGPNCSHNAFYDYLTQQNQKASEFFFVLR